MSARALGLAIAGAAIRVTAARADPVAIHTERCASLDPAALAAAVDRELGLASADPQRSGPAAIDIACPDGVHARVVVARGAAAATLVRELDLGEEPAALRVKLVALAIAELLATTAVDAAGSAPPRPPPASAPPGDTADVPADAPAARVEPSVVPASLGLTVRAGARVIAGDEAALATIAAEMDLGPVRVGLAAATGDGKRDYGRPYIVALTISRAIACKRGQTVVCLVARAEAGFVGTSLHDDDDVTAPKSLYAGYGDVSAGFEFRRDIGGYHWVGDIDLGGADGLIVEQARLEHLDGPFAVITAGMSW